MHRYSLFMCYDGWYSCIAAFNNWFIFVFKLGFLRFCTHTCQHGWYPGDIFFDLFDVGAELYVMLSCCWSCFFLIILSLIFFLQKDLSPLVRSLAPGKLDDGAQFPYGSFLIIINYFFVTCLSLALKAIENRYIKFVLGLQIGPFFLAVTR